MFICDTAKTILTDDHINYLGKTLSEPAQKDTGVSLTSMIQLKLDQLLQGKEPKQRNGNAKQEFQKGIGKNHIHPLLAHCQLNLH